MKLQRITKGAWGGGAEPEAAGKFCDFAVENNNFNVISFTFRTFLKPYE